MTINSMTGFARCEGAASGLTWHWEARSLNAKGLDVRLRLATGFEALEPRVREMLGSRFKRGSFQVLLAARREAGEARVRINRPALDSILAALKTLPGDLGAAKPRLDGILGLKGVLEVAEAERGEDETAKEQKAVLKSLKETLSDLALARAEEGLRLKDIVSAQVDDIEVLANEARKSSARTPEAIKARLGEHIARILDNGKEFDPDRLHQEAVLIAAKADIQEELDRLDAHVAAARDLLAAAEPVGRRLDFLTQEFLREANTLCSKANAASLTSTGLKLKAVIDQMREQVQNIE